MATKKTKQAAALNEEITAEVSASFQELMEDDNEGVVQLAPGLTSEEMLAAYLNEDELIKAPQRVYRLNSSNHRYYYTFDIDGEPEFFTSVTTMIKQTMPTNPFLIKWIAEMGHEEAKAYAADKAAYGTFMHAEIATLLMVREYDTETLRDRLKAYIEKERLPQSFINYTDDVKSDVLAFAQFMIDYNVKPLAIEIVLTHPTDGYAGALDLPCIMEITEKGFFGEVLKSGINKGQPKETKRITTVTAIIDFKSGKKGFYPENEVQLQAYREMWDYHFPGKTIERLYNWSPKDWRTSPTYNLKDQTNSKEAAKLPYYVALNRIENNKRDNTVTVIQGKIDLKQGLDRNLTEITLGDLVKTKRKNKERDIAE